MRANILPCIDYLSFPIIDEEADAFLALSMHSFLQTKLYPSQKKNKSLNCSSRLACSVELINTASTAQSLWTLRFPWLAITVFFQGLFVHLLDWFL
jgi:hypothetical protein